MGIVVFIIIIVICLVVYFVRKRNEGKQIIIKKEFNSETDIRFNRMSGIPDFSNVDIFNNKTFQIMFSEIANILENNYDENFKNDMISFIKTIFSTLHEDFDEEELYFDEELTTGCYEILKDMSGYILTNSLIPMFQPLCVAMARQYPKQLKQLNDECCDYLLECGYLSQEEYYNYKEWIALESKI